MKRMYVCHWIPNDKITKDTGFKNNDSFPYTIEKRNEIIDIVLGKGYNIMLKQVTNKALIILIDDKRFQQR